MTYYEQLVHATVQAMGKQKGWCLQNCRLAYGFKVGKYASAKADMEWQRANGVLHDISTLPNNVIVPVYVDTNSKYEHVILSFYGVFYEDGKKINRDKYTKFFGWGEYCNGVRIVEWQNEPQPTTGFLPPKGYWGRYDKDERVNTLSKFMRATFPSYTPSSALGPIYGDNLWRSIAEFQRRAKADGNYNSTIDGNTGPKTYEALKKYGFKG